MNWNHLIMYRQLRETQSTNWFSFLVFHAFRDTRTRKSSTHDSHYFYVSQNINLNELVPIQIDRANIYLQKELPLDVDTRIFAHK